MQGKLLRTYPYHPSSTRQMILAFGLAFACLLAGAWAGGPCPPREDIYPCSCANIPIGKRLFHTIVSCHKLGSTDALSAILRSLRSLEIDQLYLYDSFWEAHLLGEAGEPKKVLPTDFFSLKAKEIQIVDSTLAEGFACDVKSACRNTVTTKFTMINSTSSSGKVTLLCPTSGNNYRPWTSCMGKLRNFHYTDGALTTIGPDFFATAMRELMVVNFTRNKITKVSEGAFQKLPRLKELDLSNNFIFQLDKLFSSSVPSLDFLDLSSNSLKTIGPDLIRYAPNLKFLWLANNQIEELKESEWKAMQKDLKNIDVTGNPIHCDCNIRWINSTMAVHVVLSGTCATPEEFEGTYIRKASRFVNERCDEKGSIGTRTRNKATTPMKALLDVSI